MRVCVGVGGVVQIEVEVCAKCGKIGVRGP